MKKYLLPFFFTAFALALQPVHAAVVFSDNFESGDVDATDNTADGDGVSGTSGWAIDFSTGGSPAVTAVTDTTSPWGAGNNAMNVNTGGNTFYGARAGFSMVNLAIGDVLTATADVRYTSDPDNNGSGFRFGLYDSTTLGSAYWVKASTLSSAGSASAIIQDGAGQNFGFENTGAWDFEALATAGSGENMDDTDVHTFTLTMTRLSATQVRLQSTFDGAFDIDVTDDTATGNGVIFTSFDSIGFRNGSVNESFRVDNVTVQHSAIPEPSSLVLMLGGLSLLWFNRRR